jgi:carbon storage regulator
MLVLNRKVGQQIILPEQGITIDVVEVGRTRVRLGIAAPSDMPIHRREVWDRRLGAGQGLPASDDSAQERVAMPEAEGDSAGIETSPVNLDSLLSQRIIERTGGRISQLSVETHDGQIVIRGRARSHFACQLAHAAVQEIIDVCNPPGCPVEVNIDVRQVYWRSAGHTPGLTRLLG